VGKMDGTFKRNRSAHLRQDSGGFRPRREPRSCVTGMGRTFGQSCIWPGGWSRPARASSSELVRRTAWHGWDVHGADLQVWRAWSRRLPAPRPGLIDPAGASATARTPFLTLVVVTGEFGRRPRSTSMGPDHCRAASPSSSPAARSGCSVIGAATSKRLPRHIVQLRS